MREKNRSGKNYADILTILIVIIIIAIIALIGFVAVKVISKKNAESNAANANDKFLATTEENKKKKEKVENKTEEKDTNTDTNSTSDSTDRANLEDLIGKTSGGNNNDSSQPQTQTPSQTQSNVKKEYMGNYEIKGSINIPKTKCNYPILEKVTVDSLNKAVAILDIVANPELNRTVKDLNVPGTNAFILGHNYLNGQFFSDNDKLAVGDKINIVDQLGTTVTYTIYDMFFTSPDDVSFMERDVDINTREITLQTCNENSSQRLIILAKDN